MCVCVRGGEWLCQGPSARTNCEIQAGTERKHPLTRCCSVTAVCFDVLTSVLMGLIQLSVSDTAAAAAAAKSLNTGTLSIHSFRDEQRLVYSLRLTSFSLKAAALRGV